MTAILGISAFYHDSAAALVVDGRIVAAAQEERFTRKKHDHRFPTNAIEYCLEEGGLEPNELDYVGFYDKPFLKFDRLLETYLTYAPIGFRSFTRAMPLWLKQKLRLPREMDRGLKKAYKKRYVFTEHHESHAASAFFPSPFEEAAILTLDGVGEWATASFGIGRGNRIELTHELHFPHSLGLLYSAFTYYCGFRVNSGEYKLMGLAPYGEPKYADRIREKLIDLKEDGSFRVDLSYFNYCQGLTMTSRKFHDLFGAPPRPPETPIRELDMDVAASIQLVSEEIMLKAACHVHEVTGLDNLCLAGGVALNCVGNGRILREGPFSRLWIQPAAGDAGGALGTALFIWHQLLDNPRSVDNVHDTQEASLLGPRFDDDQIRSFLDEAGATYHHYEDEEDLLDAICRCIAEEKVVGHLHGRMEFGPRALGNRSIIGDARSRKMQSVMNLKIKFRESFRPFAPIVLRDHVHEWFDMRPNEDSPYMLLVAPVHESRRLETNGEAVKGLDRLKGERSTVPAITHVDYSARVQTVDERRHGRLHRLIQRFNEQSGCPVLINTSFNIRGEPIVCSGDFALD
jgi:carbamoyltransferase